MSKRLPRGRNWSPAERLIIYKMVLQGNGLYTINQALASYQQSNSLSHRQVPESSFNMMLKTYLPYLTNENLESFALKPPSMGKLRNMPR